MSGLHRGIPADVRAIVDARDCGICQRCGMPTGSIWWSRHHRKPRGMGGSKLYDTASNIVTLCGSGSTGCHGWVESHREQAYAAGWLVRRNSIDDPESIPLTTYAGRFYLLPDGSRVATSQPGGAQ